MPTLTIKGDELIIEAIKDYILLHKDSLLNSLVDSYGLTEDQAEDMIENVKMKES